MEIKVRKIGNKNKGSKLGRMSKEKKKDITLSNCQQNRNNTVSY